MRNKRCKKCSGSNVKKDGKMRWKQRYKCKLCWYVFQNRRKKITTDKLWNEYSTWKQIYWELEVKYHVSKVTIQKYLDIKLISNNNIVPQQTVLLIDTTYFWRKYWIMVFRSYELKKNLYWKEVKRENKEEYLDGIRYLEGLWWEILGIVCDWKRWLLWWIGNIPTQMCHFHQKQIIQRYLTQKPKLEASKELKEVSSWVWKGRYEVMREYLEDWHRRHQLFLNERNEEWGFKHKRVRQAYRSLKSNLKYLYTYEFLKEKIQLPTTTNWLEAVFWHLKQKVGIHRWLKKWRKLRLIDDLLSK